MDQHQLPSDDRLPSTDFVTHDPEAAHDFLCSAYTDNTMRVGGSPENFRMAHGVRDGGRFTVASLSHSMAIEHRVQPLDRLLFCRVVSGRIERETAGELGRFTAGELFPVAAPDQPYAIRWDDRGTSMELIEVDAGALAAVSGLPERTWRRARVRLHAVDPAAARFSLRMADHLTRDLLTNPEAMANPLVVGSAARALAGALLLAFPPEPDEPAGGGSASAAVVRRAIAFIDEQAHTDLTLGRIAEAVRVSPRTLQLAFRRQLDSTPMSMVRRVRLDRAHSELRQADPAAGATVAGIALRWGFANPSGFAARYRAAFGVSPSETLRRTA